MKKIFLSLFIFSCTLTLFAQQPVQPAVADTVAKAKIVFEYLNHNYGQIAYGSDGTCTFKFKNEGAVPLILSNVRASCGCTTPSWTKDPVAPGQSGEIKVTYDTHRRGAFSKSVTVTSNAVETPSVVLRISGEVKQNTEPQTSVN